MWRRTLSRFGSGTFIGKTGMLAAVDPETGRPVNMNMMADARESTLKTQAQSAARGHLLLIGSAVEIADVLERWFRAGAADGFNVMPPFFPGQFDAFVDQVVPLLQERGLFRTDYTGTTLRDHLGLKRPARRP